MNTSLHHLMIGIATDVDGSVIEYPTIQWSATPESIDHAATSDRPAFRTTFRSPTDDELAQMGLAREGRIDLLNEEISSHDQERVAWIVQLRASQAEIAELKTVLGCLGADEKETKNAE